MRRVHQLWRTPGWDAAEVSCGAASTGRVGRPSGAMRGRDLDQGNKSLPRFSFFRGDRICSGRGSQTWTRVRVQLWL